MELMALAGGGGARGVALLAMLASSGLVRPVHADSTTPPTPRPSGDGRDPVLAETLRRDGELLLARKQYALACTKLSASQQLQPRSVTLLALARCHANLGHMAAATRVLRDAAATARVERDAPREHAAITALESLLPRIPTLRIRAIGHPVLELDGAPFAEDRLDVEMQVDVGTHTLVARAPDHGPWSQTVELGMGDHELMQVPQLSSRTIDLGALDAASQSPDEILSELDEDVSRPRRRWRVSATTVSGSHFDPTTGLRSPVLAGKLAARWSLGQRAWMAVGGALVRDQLADRGVTVGNPSLTAGTAVRTTAHTSLAPQLAIALPLGQGGGNTPDPGIAINNAGGRACGNGQLFDPNYVGAAGSVSLSFEAAHVSVVVTPVVMGSARVRGEQASAAAYKLSVSPRVHVGYRALGSLELFAESLYTRAFLGSSFVSVMTGGGVAWTGHSVTVRTFYLRELYGDNQQRHLRFGGLELGLAL